MADNDETDVPEDGTQGPDPTVDEAVETEADTDATAADDGGADDGDDEAEGLGDANVMTAGADGEDELLAQEDPPEITRTARDLDAVYDIPVQLSAVLGRANMQVSQLLKLGRGAVVELDRKVGEAIDIYVNNRLVARGEVVVVEERLGITMTEIIKSDRAS